MKDVIKAYCNCAKLPVNVVCHISPEILVWLTISNVYSFFIWLIALLLPFLHFYKIQIVIGCLFNCYLSQICIRFLAKDDVTGVTQLKGSVQRGLRTKLVEQYPPLEKWINQIAPKKENIVLIKWCVSF